MFQHAIGRAPTIGVAVLFAILTAVPVVGAAGPDPFKGSYSAIDVDGSRMTVSFSGSGPTRTVTLFDERATCLGGDPLTTTGIGTISGSTISGSSSDGGCGVGSFSLAYDAGTDTLFDGTITWYRGDRGPDAFNGVWYATDPFDGSAMRLSLDGSGLIRDASFKDDGASVCGPVIDGEGIDWTGTGDGTIGSTPGFGRFLYVTLTGGCAGSAHDSVHPVTYEYLYLTNTLLDSDGATWARKS